MRRKLVKEKPLPRMSSLDAEIKREVKKALVLMDKIDSMKEVYKELDDITVLLRKLRFTGVRVSPGTDIILRDNFADSNTAFRSAGVKHFELFLRKDKAHAK